MPAPPPELEREVAAAVARATGARVVGVRAVAGGHTRAVNVVAALAGGGSVFAKAAAEEQTRGWLRAEHAAYATVGAQPFLPGLRGWEDGALSVLVLEDLSAARWPPPWDPPRDRGRPRDPRRGARRGAAGGMAAAG